MLSFVEKYLLAPGSILGLEGLFVKGFDLFDKKGKGPAQVSIDADIGMDNLVDFDFIDIEMNNLGVGGKVFHVTSDAVIKACPEAKEQVTVGNAHVGRIGSVHTGQTQLEVPTVGDGPFAHEGCDDRNTKGFYKRTKQGRRFTENQAAPREDEGLPSFFEGFDGFIDVFFVALDAALIAAEADRIRVGEVKLGIKDIFGNIDKDRTGPSRGSNVKASLMTRGSSLTFFTR